MTPQQLATLKTYIDSQPDLASEPNNDDGHFAIAAKLTQTANPDFFVWRLSVPVNDIMGNGFNWTLVDNLVVGRARIWEWMTMLGAINPGQPNVRSGINAAFAGGTGGFPEMRTGIYGHCQTLATRGQKVFATGSGTTSSDSGTGPGNIVIDIVLASDVQQARNPV